MNTRCRCKYNPTLKTTVGNPKKDTHAQKHIVYHARYEKPPKKTFFRFVDNEGGNAETYQRLMQLCMNDVNDSCLATGKGTTEKIPEFQVGIEPKTSVGYTNQ